MRVALVVLRGDTSSDAIEVVDDVNRFCSPTTRSIHDSTASAQSPFLLHKFYNFELEDHLYMNSRLCDSC
jgi:hypothetical protein